MAGNLELIHTQDMSTSTSDIDITNLFSDTYSTYFISTSGVESSGYSRFTMRLLDSGGTAITATEYDVAILLLNSASSFTESRATSDNRFYQFLGYNLTVGGGNSQGATAYIHNPYDSSSYTFVTLQASTYGGATPKLYGSKYIGVHKSAEQLSGIQMIRSDAATMDNMTVNVYGLASN